MDTMQRSELLKSIKHIGYDESLLSEDQLSSALADGPKSVEYTKLINFLSTELRELCNLDEHINTITAPEDSITFIMETSSFLNELGCPYERLVQGPISDRLCNTDDRYLLIKYLISELVAARILRENQPGKRLDLKLRESEQASDLRKILQILGYPQPPKNITMQNLLKKLMPSVQNLISKAPKDLIGKPIFNGTLSEAQWDALEKVNQDLHDEYFIRREMLLKRLDCTIQSFQWSGKTKGKDDKFEREYGDKRKQLSAEPGVGIADLVAARDDVAIIEKTSNASVRKHTKSSVNKVIIGAVPDRGGRTTELAPPPPEMPPWQQRNAGPAGGGGGGRGGFSRGGGNSFPQGGSNARGGRGGGSNFSNNRGSFDSAGSYGDSTRGYGQSNYPRGGGASNYSNNRGSFGSSDSSRGGGGGNYSSTGSSFGSSGNYGDSSRGYSQSNNSRGSFDSAGNYGDSSRDYSQSGSGGNYSRGGGAISRDNNSYSRDNNSGYSRESNTGYSRDNSGYSRGGSFDSAGSYGGQSYQEPKRVKTFDQFQQNKSTYADQYVQESQQNMQFQSRDRDHNRYRDRGGRSNYNRGGGSYR